MKNVGELKERKIGRRKSGLEKRNRRGTEKDLIIWGGSARGKVGVGVLEKKNQVIDIHLGWATW